MDINCNIKRLYTTSYSLSNRFRNCSKYVCILLFKTFCSNMYLCSLWDTDNAYFKKIQVAYNNAYRISLGYKPRCSASEMYLYDNVDNIKKRSILPSLRYQNAPLLISQNSCKTSLNSRDFKIF